MAHRVSNLMRMSLPSRAWVPWSEAHVSDSEELAVGGTEQQCREAAATALVLVPVHKPSTPLGRLASSLDGIRSAASGARSTRRTSPATALSSWLDPDPKLLERGTSLARNGAICVLEWPTFPLRGWALESLAVDLTTGQVAEDVRTPAQMKVLGFLMMYGNHEWGDKRDTSQIRGLLKGLADEGMDPEVTIGIRFARSHNATAVLNLRQHRDHLG